MFWKITTHPNLYFDGRTSGTGEAERHHKPATRASRARAAEADRNGAGDSVQAKGQPSLRG